jgi:two-component system, OmpR family, phosphate regulon response regulator PhoB
MSRRILIVDDEPDVSRLLAFSLRAAGFETLEAATGKSALEATAEVKPDVVILDLMLPDLTGYEVCRRMRADPMLGEAGILILTARGEEIDRIAGFEVGADDYVVKPFSVREVVLRVQSLMRRVAERSEARAASGTGPRVIRLHDLEIDLKSYEVRRSGELLALRPLEFKLLATLAAEPGRVYTREELLAEVWEIHEAMSTRTVDVHIQRLRQALGPAAAVIETVTGFGYRAAR